MADIFTVNQSKYLYYKMLELGISKNKANNILGMVEEFVEKEFLQDAAFEQLADKYVAELEKNKKKK